MANKKEAKTNKQKQIAKKFTEESDAVASERHKMLINFRFLEEWERALTHQFNAYRDMITMIRQQRNTLIEQLQVLGDEPVPEVETK